MSAWSAGNYHLVPYLGLHGPATIWLPENENIDVRELRDELPPFAPHLLGLELGAAHQAAWLRPFDIGLHRLQPIPPRFLLVPGLADPLPIE